MSSRIVLGRGLDALFPNKGSQPVAEKRFRMVAVDHIQPNPMQPRQSFNDDRLSELADSFKKSGIMQPLVVTQEGENFVIIAGERRLRAAKLAGMAEVPVVLMDQADDARRLELALVENLQRENLNPIEVANAYRMLIDKCGLSQQQLAEQVHKSRTAVTNTLRLLSLPMPIQQLVRKGRLTEGHARAVLSLNTEEEMLRFAEKIVKSSLSVRETEDKARGIKKRRLIPRRKAPMITEFETNLKQVLGTSVKILPGLKRGKIEIEYYGNEDLERIVALLRRVQS